jgi:patatin-like phospholipase/acyl hydrolase
MTDVFEVLSIDGGGIRGVVPAIVLAEIEERTGRPAAERFDLIVGTSTGGIPALGLTAACISSGPTQEWPRERLLEGPEIEGARRGGSWHPQEGSRGALRSLSLDHKTLVDQKAQDRRCGHPQDPRQAIGEG